MSCTFSREMLALHVEGDLSKAAAALASQHVASCVDCQQFVDELRDQQWLVKSLRRDEADRAECAEMRRDVMSIISDSRYSSGWALELERAIVLGVQARSYAMAALACIGIISVSILAQARFGKPDLTAPAAVFEGRETLRRPDNYRDWTLVGSTETIRTYINPDAYREYVKTKQFPEGTVMVLEAAGNHRSTNSHASVAGVLASVKDSTRFEGGWGFFDFTARGGKATPETLAIPDAGGCRTCHRKDAETDSVFTQFYPLLRQARAGTEPV